MSWGEGIQSDIFYWFDKVAFIKEQLAEAEENLQEILKGSSVKVSDDVALEVAKSQLQVEQSQMQLEDTQISVEDAKYDLEDAQLAIEDAQKALDDAQEKWGEAKSKSPVITAPFAGFITTVNIEGGDEVMTGTVAVQLADPDKFKAEIVVSEMDISQIKVGGEAQVQVDAMSGPTLPAKVTHISPTATIQSGVVNYKVKVEVQSLEAMVQERQAVRQEAMDGIQPGELPERLKQAVEEGRITQEQVEEMMKQRQQGQGGQQGQMPTMIAEGFQLREGLTVTVSMIVDERNDVLLVPNGTITTQGRQTYAQVLSPDGTIEERAITTGISNWQYTEVTEGLSEGEQVVVPQGTTSTSTTQQQQGGMFIPGMGRPR
ncbi:efflux RND transporter periplasmic adaptor subunit [Chloroflexota bacterium]